MRLKTPKVAPKIPVRNKEVIASSGHHYRDNSFLFYFNIRKHTCQHSDVFCRIQNEWREDMIYVKSKNHQCYNDYHMIFPFLGDFDKTYVLWFGSSQPLKTSNFCTPLVNRNGTHDYFRKYFNSETKCLNIIVELIILP